MTASAITSLPALSRKLPPGRRVLVTGCFDILHPAHIKFLKKARRVGDVLMVGLETDKRIRIIKGPNRPINPASVRLANLKNLNLADVVFLLPEDLNKREVQEQIIRLLKPAVLAVSSHSPYKEVKRALMEKYGGRLMVVMKKDPTHSTSKLIAKLKAQNKS